MKNNNPIGVFDSGVGGLSVLKEVLKVLPNENYIYFGDTLRVPYGDKSIEELTECTIRILDFFKTQNVKMVLVACNTCSANTINLVKDQYDFEILGLIKPTSDYVKTLNIKKIGLIATTATVNSQAYSLAIEPYGITVFQKSCPELVKLVENGETNTPHVKNILCEYLNPLKERGIEKLILGCTHYPFLIPAIKSLGFDNNFFVNPAICSAYATKNFLIEKNLLNMQKKGKYEFFVSSSPEDFIKNAKLFFGQINNVKLYK